MELDKKKQETLELIQEYRLIDDTFMTVVFKDKECTQLLIRCLLQRDDLQVIKVDTQEDLKNLWGRSARLDILAHDADGTLYNIEVQRADKGASQKRARYNSSLLDSNITEPGAAYEKLTETYVIFITENDYFGKALPLYHIERMIQETGELFNDDEHILYVNGQYRGDDAIGRLMHDFFCKEAKDIHNAILAQNVRHYKTEKEGVETMCRVSEKIQNKEKAEDVKNLMETTGWSFEQTCDKMKIPAERRPTIKEIMQSM